MLLMGSREQEGSEPYVGGSALLPVTGATMCLGASKVAGVVLRGRGISRVMAPIFFVKKQTIHSKVRGMVKGTEFRGE